MKKGSDPLIVRQGNTTCVNRWDSIRMKAVDYITEPTDDAAAYPAYEDVLAKYETVRAAVIEYVGSLTDDDLEKPSHAPEEMQAFFGTVGQCLAAITVHLSFHGGQLADARRAAGRSALMG